MPIEWKEYITSDLEILHGKAHRKRAGILVSLILGYLAEGKTAEEITAEFPDLTREQFAPCFGCPRYQAEFEVTV